MCLCVCVFVCVYQNGVIPVLRHLNCCIIIYIFFFRILTLLHRRMFRAILLFYTQCKFLLSKIIVFVVPRQHTLILWTFNFVLQVLNTLNYTLH